MKAKPQVSEGNIPLEHFELVPKQEVFGALKRPEEPDVKLLMTWEERSAIAQSSRGPKWLSEMRDSYRGFFFSSEEDALYRVKFEATKPLEVPSQMAKSDEAISLTNRSLPAQYEKAKVSTYKPKNPKQQAGKKQKPTEISNAKTSTNKPTVKDIPSKKSEKIITQKKSSGNNEDKDENLEEEECKKDSQSKEEETNSKEKQNKDQEEHSVSFLDDPGKLSEDYLHTQNNLMETTYQGMSNKLPSKVEPTIKEPYKYCEDCLASMGMQANVLRPPHDLGEIPVQELNPQNYRSLPTQWTKRIPAAGKLSYRSPESYSVIFYDPEYA